MNNSVLYAKAIQNLKPNCEFGVRWDKVKNEPIFRHYGGDALPTKAQIQTEVDRIRTSETARDNRMGEYPELAEQFDKLYHDIDSGTVDKTGSFYTALKAVKDKYPKG